MSQKSIKNANDGKLMLQGLKTEQFTVGYGKEPLIKEVELSVEPGKILTLIGPNGSGKSTILKSITRQLKPLGGFVYLDGKSMETMNETDVAKSLSMVMTEHLKPELMSCREVVATGRYPYTGRLGILTKADWDAVGEAMELVHATEVADKDFTMISDGQKQRVMLARAICQDTKTLVLDEPTSYLDMRYKLDILSNIRRLAREKNLAVIMSLHELDLAQKVSDVIACVDGDRVSHVGTPDEIFRDDYIQRLYHIKKESFDPILGTMQMPANTSTPKVFVIGGGGAGISVYYRLQREHIPFAVGILGENDVEYAIAKAIASEVVSTKAFYPIGEEEFVQAKRWIDQCDECICAVDEFGPFNEKNKELFEYAIQMKKCCQKN